MENNTTIEKLIEKAEIYSKTSLELCKYEAVYKSADISSNLAVKLVVAIVVLLFVLFTTIGLSFYIGSLLGAVSLGFFVIGLGYLFIGLLVFVFRKEWIKTPVSNFIISKMNKSDLI